VIPANAWNVASQARPYPSASGDRPPLSSKAPPPRPPSPAALAMAQSAAWSGVLFMTFCVALLALGLFVALPRYLRRSGQASHTVQLLTSGLLALAIGTNGMWAIGLLIVLATQAHGNASRAAGYAVIAALFFISGWVCLLTQWLVVIKFLAYEAPLQSWIITLLVVGICGISTLGLATLAGQEHDEISNVLGIVMGLSSTWWGGMILAAGLGEVRQPNPA
jgi:hypothetical protein